MLGYEDGIMKKKQESEARFYEAAALYRRGCYAQALRILDELDAQQPGRRRILLPKARCLSRLGCTEEALDICDDLIWRFDYEKARLLRERIVRRSGTRHRDTPPPERQRNPDFLFGAQEAVFGSSSTGSPRLHHRLVIAALLAAATVLALLLLH